LKIKDKLSKRIYNWYTWDGVRPMTEYEDLKYGIRKSRSIFKYRERPDKPEKEQIIKDAGYWMNMPDDDIWDLMFSHTIPRTTSVCSNGNCPSCRKSLGMYDWIIDAKASPWKVKCPNCGELFPKNDFHRYYMSGLDEKLVFKKELADDALLFNADHPDADDELHRYGVDDGYGFTQGNEKWNFVGTYLFYGQWQQLIYDGVVKLANAYTVSGDKRFAVKAMILLDSIADMFTEFDGAISYGTIHGEGYVTQWSTCTAEMRNLVLAYDQIFDAVVYGGYLVGFLSEKAQMRGLENKKESFDRIQENIEDRIFYDAINNPEKINGNYPGLEATVTIIKTVLGWPENRHEIESGIGSIIRGSTSVDGVTGEKGLPSYSAGVLNTFAELLALYSSLDEEMIKRLADKNPELKKTFKFHVDTWCLCSFYPCEGDGKLGGMPEKQYIFSQYYKKDSKTNSMTQSILWPPYVKLLWYFYRISDDSIFLKILYRECKDDLKKITDDLITEEVEEIIAIEGPEIYIASANKEKWHIAVLQSNRKDGHAAWIDYDTGGSHSHEDGMNIGYFAKGLDIMPDFGYPPVGFGGENNTYAEWYRMAEAHNTVIIDGQRQVKKGFDTVGGETALWIDSPIVKGICINGDNIAKADVFSREIVQIDFENGGCLVDIFRVSGGRDHKYYLHTLKAKTIHSQGLEMKRFDETYKLLPILNDQGNRSTAQKILKDFSYDPNPDENWFIEIDADDVY